MGGAAITEELRPGFWFTTFSYALSLLRPQIIHELELTKHGFLPLLMSTRFAPTEGGEYLTFTKHHDANLREIARISPHDADAYEQYSHDLARVCQVIKPLLDTSRPTPSATIRRSCWGWPRSARGSVASTSERFTTPCGC